MFKEEPHPSLSRGTGRGEMRGNALALASPALRLGSVQALRLRSVSGRVPGEGKREDNRDVPVRPDRLYRKTGRGRHECRPYKMGDRDVPLDCSAKRF